MGTSKNGKDKWWFNLKLCLLSLLICKNITSYLGVYFLFFVFFFFILKPCILCLYSFGKQLGGRRGCECITLEPSEMIVVSYKHDILETLNKQIYVIFTVTVITAAHTTIKGLSF